MISLEQIRSLEQKVNQVIEQLNRAREENARLRAKVKSTQSKTAELESTVNTYKHDQDAIEKSILSVLSKLDKLEDEVSLSGAAPKKESPQPAPKADETSFREKENRKTAGGAKAASGGAQDELDIF